MNKTIASLALLKANWDRLHQDYLENFVPFIVTLAHRKKYRMIDVSTIRKDFEAEFGLSIPYHPMIAILNRTKKRGYISKSGPDAFVPNDSKLVEDDFSDVVVLQEQKYARVIDDFIGYCRDAYHETVSPENADRIFVAFLKDHDLDVLFATNAPQNTLLPEVDTSGAERFLINSFVKHAHESNPEIFGFVTDISIGHIIANTLLYRDFEKFQGKLTGNYYLDTGLLFSLMGINGVERFQAYRDFLELLLFHGARLFVFRHTLDEFMGILESCVKRIETKDYDPARASRALMFFRENGFSSSDIERFVLAVGNGLAALRINIVDVPPPMKDVAHQIGEEDLSNIIVGVYKQFVPSFDENEKDHTIYQDVRSISAIYKLRHGEKPIKLTDAKHVFVTANASLARASREYEVRNSSTDYFFIPASLTDVFLGTLIWLRSPSRVSELHEKRLIANCYASLQPSRALLKKFVNEVQKLSEAGEVTADDVTMLKESRVARNLLQEETLGDPGRFTDRTVTEVLEELKARMEAEAASRFEVDRQTFLAELEGAGAIRDRYGRTMSNIERLATKAAAALIWVISLLLLVLVAALAAFQLNQQIFGDNRYVTAILVGLVIFWAMATAYTGLNIRGVGERLRKKLTRYIVGMLAGSRGNVETGTHS